MKMISSSLRSPHVRRLIVAVAVASGGAAVAGAVVLAERPAHIDRPAAHATADPLDGRAAVSAAGHLATRSPKDAWRALPPPWTHQATTPVLAADPSLPAAADAVGAAPDSGGEPPATF